MKRLRASVSSLAVVGLFAGYYGFLHRGPDSAEYLGDMGAWPPDAAAVQNAVRVSARDNGSTLAARRELFAHLFKQRFRKHQPPKAIGLSFAGERKLLLKLGALKDPWNIDRVALAAWQEAYNAFGVRFDIDFYETNIASPPIKIGELHPLDGHPDIAYIIHDLPRSRSRR